ncbi:hypothetical protein ILYODFUR_024694 [Ilyodon furcidens]|uniref:SEA domain-containing protein n=1 Tax=Ilyodon furcidens TaxID=33524 RepID=A0ABV0UMU9_9TELE
MTVPSFTTFTIRTSAKSAAPITNNATLKNNTAPPAISGVPTISTSALTKITDAPTTITVAPKTITAARITTTANQTNPTLEATTAQTTTIAPALVFVVRVTVYEPFVEPLTDVNSNAFKELKQKVIDAFDEIYRKRFGALFIGSFVNAIRVSSTIIRMNATEVDVRVVFNKTTPLENLPENKVVQETLEQAIKTTTFNVTFLPGSVQIIYTPLPTTTPTNSTVTAITAAANATTKASATNENTTALTNTTTAKPITASTTTTTTTTTTTGVKPTTTTTTVESTITKRLTFRSARETFTIDLLNPSSTAFINRAALLKSNLEPLFQRAFSSLRTFVVIFFSNGSIINNIDLGFSSAFVPTNRQIAEVLVNASSNITAFNIDTSFIFVDDIQMSSGVSHKISLITAFSMVLLSWLLTSQQ